MADSICIWTPQGLKCSASPVLSHGKGKANPVSRSSIQRRKKAMLKDLTNLLNLNWKASGWPPPTQGSPRSAARRALVTARVIELMCAANVDDATRFTIVRMRP
jgi:hypothetical protein